MVRALLAVLALTLATASCAEAGVFRARVKVVQSVHPAQPVPAQPPVAKNPVPIQAGPTVTVTAGCASGGCAGVSSSGKCRIVSVIRGR